MADSTTTAKLPTLCAMTKRRRPERAMQRVRAKLVRGGGSTPVVGMNSADLAQVLKASPAYASDVLRHMRGHAEVWAPGLDGVDPVQGVVLDNGREVFLHPIDLQIAQTATALTLQPHVERCFERTSYAYRVGRSMHDALYTARVLSRTHPFAAKADIRKFFPNTGVEKVSAALVAMLPGLDESWHRWLGYLMSSSVFRLSVGDPEPRGMLDSDWTPRDVTRPHAEVVAGTAVAFERAPMVILQGSVLGPVLSNIVGHVMVDAPVRTLQPEVVCLRYADDMLLLGKTAGHVELALEVLDQSVTAWGYQLHPEKTSPCAVDLRDVAMPWLGKELARGIVRTPDEWIAHRVEQAVGFSAHSREARAELCMLLRAMWLDPRAHLDEVVASVFEHSIDHYHVIEDVFPRTQASRTTWLRSSNRKMLML